MEWAEAIKAITEALATAPGFTLVLIIALVAVITMPVIGAFLIYTLSRMVKSYGERDSALGHALGAQTDFMNKFENRFSEMTGAVDRVGDAMQASNMLAAQARGALEVTSAALLDMKKTVMTQHETMLDDLDTVKIDAHETLEIVRPLPQHQIITQESIRALEAYFKRMETVLTAVNTSLDLLCESIQEKPHVKQMELTAGRIIGAVETLHSDLQTVSEEVHELLARTASPDLP